MSYYLIVKTGWRFEPLEFSRQLRTRWPAVQAKEIQNHLRKNVLEFEFPAVGATLFGSLNREGTAVIFHANRQDCAEFSSWCRSLIPPSEDVVLCDESMTIHFELKPEMAPADIIQAIRSSEEE